MYRVITVCFKLEAPGVYLTLAMFHFRFDAVSDSAKNAEGDKRRQVLPVTRKGSMIHRLLVRLFPETKLIGNTKMELELPKLRKMNGSYLGGDLPNTWDSLLLYDEQLGVKIGSVAEPTARVKNILVEHVPAVIADIILQYCRRMDFRTILDLQHPSNQDVQELLEAFCCTID